ncbi:hypothetical protein F4777DRAFT_576580 [Nemania sp. FL0916]|nr:hypothetical protein F4777DRAFT_576580 [Nemania sp. FL0916]
MKSSLLSAAALLVPIALGWDITKRKCPSYDLCFQSFLWCPPDASESCSFPPGAYAMKPPPSRSVNAALLIADTNYTVAWTKTPPVDDPVTVQWNIARDIKWRTNITGTEFILEPGKILDSFPTTEYPNVSSAEAWHAATQDPTNSLTISRFSRPGRTGIIPSDFSQQFIVQPLWMRQYLSTQATISRDETYNKWKLGVGIGVGVGVPVLLVLTVLATLSFVKKGGRVRSKKSAK